MTAYAAPFTPPRTVPWLGLVRIVFPPVRGPIRRRKRM